VAVTAAGQQEIMELLLSSLVMAVMTGKEILVV
jgi:hypothetical protein